MNVCAIIGEYNPFHKGHKFHMEETRRQLGDCKILCIMSGNYVQRAEPALFDKWLRARAAVLGGANLVLELPTTYAIASAPRFAQNAVALAVKSQCVTHLSFGSESGNLPKLQTLSTFLLSSEPDPIIARWMDTGMSYASAREKTVGEALGQDYAALLRTPNDILAVEYCKAISSSSSSITPIAIRRTGSGYHQPTPEDGYLSATAARGALLEGKMESIAPYLPETALPLYQEAMGNGQVRSLEKYETALMAHLRLKSKEDFLSLPDVSEGLEDRILAKLCEAKTIDALCTAVSTKRYPISRIRRILLCSFLGISKEMLEQPPQYLRALAFDQDGRELLKKINQDATLPALVKTANLPDHCKDAFSFEAKATDVYLSLTKNIQPCGQEYTRSPIYIEK